MGGESVAGVLACRVTAYIQDGVTVPRQRELTQGVTLKRMQLKRDGLSKDPQEGLFIGVGRPPRENINRSANLHCVE